MQYNYWGEISMLKLQVKPNLQLILLEKKHATSVFNLIEMNRPYLNKWLPWVNSSQCLEDISNYIDLTITYSKSYQGLYFGIWLNEELIGIINYHNIDWINKKTSISYWLDEKSQGQGIITQVCKKLIDYAFNSLNLNRIEIECPIENIRSIAIPERLGFSNNGLIQESNWLFDDFNKHYLYILECAKSI